MPRNRALRILLLPVLAITFMIGWALYTIGGRQRPRKVLQKNTESPRKVADLEMGLLAEVEEKPIAVRE